MQGVILFWGSRGTILYCFNSKVKCRYLPRVDNILAIMGLNRDLLIKLISSCNSRDPDLWDTRGLMSGSLCVRECSYVFEDVQRRFKRDSSRAG